MANRSRVIIEDDLFDLVLGISAASAAFANYFRTSLALRIKLKDIFSNLA